jgi:hypothetical protein
MWPAEHPAVDRSRSLPRSGQQEGPSESPAEQQARHVHEFRSLLTEVKQCAPYPRLLGEVLCKLAEVWMEGPAGGAAVALQVRPTKK